MSIFFLSIFFPFLRLKFTNAYSRLGQNILDNFINQHATEVLLDATIRKVKILFAFYFKVF